MMMVVVAVTTIGVANGTSKNVGLEKFWQDLEISEAFLVSLVFSWFAFTFFESQNFSPKSPGLGFLTRISASRRVSDFTIRHPKLYLRIITLNIHQVRAPRKKPYLPVFS